MQASSNHTSVANQSTSTPTLSPFHEEILTSLFQSGCHINSLLLDGKLTPSQLLAFANDPAVKQVLEAWESLQELHQRMLGRQAQITAAAHLDGAISDANATPEARRAATTLTKLTTHMIKPSRLHASPAPSVGSGGGGRAQQGRRGRSATTTPTRATTSTPKPTLQPLANSA